jgi:hypothetical protein
VDMRMRLGGAWGSKGGSVDLLSVKAEGRFLWRVLPLRKGAFLCLCFKVAVESLEIADVFHKKSLSY